MGTTTEIIASVRYDVNDPDKTGFTDPELLDYLNRGLKHVHSRLVLWDADIVRYLDTVNVLATDDDYPLPAGYWSTSFMYIDGENQPMRRLKVADLIAYPVTQTGTPFGFLLNATEIILRYMPNAAKTLYHYYYKEYTALALGDAMPYNGLFDQAVRQFISATALNRDEYNIQVESSVFGTLEKAAMDIMNQRLPGLTLMPYDATLVSDDYPFGRR
jgi:hypothetical protein